MFKTQTYGKWILAGEHAVLRGCPALAFPMTARHLDFVYVNSNSPLEVYFNGERGDEFKLLFFGVLEHALKKINVARFDLKGRIDIVSSLPVGAGLGASAALCGAVARWCEHKGWIEENKIYEFSRSLEDVFHGESSGVDLAVSLSGQGIRFVRDGERAPLNVKWWPQLYLSYSGQRGITSECVNKVKALFTTQPDLAETLDEQMRHAVSMAEMSLQEDSVGAQSQLKEALVLARDCFERWGLCEGNLRSHMKNLEEAGCLAVKPTGSGGGGYALSLWRTPPPENLKDKMVPLDRPKSGEKL
jgi:mevalonate kinase